MSALPLHYQTLGSTNQPPLLILHGLFGAGRNWQSIARHLSKCWQVFMPDLRNHGTSPHSPLMDFPSMASDIELFMQQHHITGCPVIAHSMGGKAACWLALTQPETISSLIVVDIAPIAYKHNFDDILNAMRTLPLADIHTRKQADTYLAKNLSPLSLRQFLLQNLIFKPHTQWRINLNYLTQAIPHITNFPDTSHLPAYRKNMLFIAGANSDYIQPKDHPIISRLFPNANIVTIPHAGHWIHAEQPQVFIQQVEQFLA